MAELALGSIALLGLVKETYLLTRFISSTASSALNAETERSSLYTQLSYEHLYLRSFGLLFFRKSGFLVPHAELNQEWTSKIAWILDSLRRECGDWSRLAAETDAVYRVMSPYVNSVGADQGTKQIDFDDFDGKCRAIVANEGDNSDKIDRTLDETDNDEHKLKKPSFFKRDWRWALREKKNLEKTLRSFQSWNAKLKELVQLSMAVNQFDGAPPHTSTHNILAHDAHAQFLGLSTHARVREISESSSLSMQELLLKDARLQLPRQTSTLMNAILEHDDEVFNVLVEIKEMSERITEEEESNFKKLVNLLACSKDTDLSTLPLKGYLMLPEQNALAFVFTYPDGTHESSPVALFDLIRRPLSLTKGLSLHYRFHIAQSIARSIAAFHADEWVHKSLRSRSIIFLHGRNGILEYKMPFLVCFEHSRGTNVTTSWTTDEDVEKNLYRHPQRQRQPQKSFNKIHDIYALGIVLLEIGLWKLISSLKEEAKALADPEGFLDPTAISEYYAVAAESRLPHTMGDSYARAVAKCIRGDFETSAESTSFPLEFYDTVVQKLDVKNLSF